MAWLTTLGKNTVWIGLTDEVTEGIYEWRSGVESSFDVSAHLGSQTGNGEDCMRAEYGKLLDGTCDTASYLYQFVCQPSRRSFLSQPAQSGKQASLFK